MPRGMNRTETRSGSKSISSRAIETASSRVTSVSREAQLFDARNASRRIATRSAIFPSGCSLSPRLVPAAVCSVASEGEVAHEVGQEDEREPPGPPLPVGCRPHLSELDHGEVERQREREDEEPARRARQEDEEEHARILRDGDFERNRQAPFRIAAVEARDVIETLAIMLAAGLLCELVADFLRLPRMVLLLGAGVLLGPFGLDILDFGLGSLGVQLLLTLGVSFILFHGGLGLSLHVLSRVGIGLAVLAVPGVLVAALITGAVASAAFDVPFEVGLLIGAVLAPTDPAILIPLFERLRLREKVGQTVIAESAVNDVVGAVLALAVAGAVLEGEESLTAPLEEFVVDLGVSTGLGIGFGLLLAVLISDRRAGVWRESPMVAVLAVIAGGYFSIETAGGSGYLGAFIAGLLVGNTDILRLGMHPSHEAALRSFTSIVTEVVVIFVFIALGVNLPLDTIPDQALPALATLATLMFLARPLIVAGALGPDRRARWKREELIFVVWTRETGVVPAALVGVLVAEGVGYEDELLTVVSLAVIVTLLLQSTTKPWLARRLGLLEAQDQG
jgi:cell volume regulation protein A